MMETLVFESRGKHDVTLHKCFSLLLQAVFSMTLVQLSVIQPLNTYNVNPWFLPVARLPN